MSGLFDVQVWVNNAYTERVFAGETHQAWVEPNATDGPDIFMPSQAHFSVIDSDNTGSGLANQGATTDTTEGEYLTHILRVCLLILAQDSGC